MLPAYPAIEESEGDWSDHLQDSVELVATRVVEQVFLELRLMCFRFRTYVRQTAHRFSVSIHYRRNQNCFDPRRLVDRRRSNRSGLPACNIEFSASSSGCRVLGMAYKDATNVLYTARLVSRAFRIQPMVR